jgi:hypothetical protein
MFKLLPKETEVETDNALEYEPLSATLAWVDEVVGKNRIRIWWNLNVGTK